MTFLFLNFLLSLPLPSEV